MIAFAFALILQDPPGGLDYVEGAEALSRGDWTSATAAFAKAVGKESENSDYYAARGAALALSEKLDEARKDLERALQLDSKNVNARLWMACVVAMKGQFGMDTQFYPFATRDLFESRLREVTKDYGWPSFEEQSGESTPESLRKRERAKKEFPELAARFGHRILSHRAAAPSLYALARKRFDEGKHDDALASFDRVLAARPDDPDVMFYHAECLRHLERYPQARVELTRVLTLQPGWKSAYIGRALCAAKMGDVRRARMDIESAMQIDPEFTRKTAIDWGKIPGGEEPNEALLDSVKNEEDAGRLMIVAGGRKKRHDEWYQDRLKELEEGKDPAALGDFLQTYAHVIGLRAEPRGPLQPIRLGNENTELNRAEKLLDQALKDNPDNITALAARTSIYMKRGGWAEAEGLIRRGLALQPNNIRILELFAEILEHAALMKRMKAADLREVKTWSDADYIYWRYPSAADREAADAYDRQADKLFQSARAYLEKAAEQKTAEGFYCKALLAWRDNRVDEARGALAESIQLKPEGRTYRLLVSVENARGDVLAALEAQSSYVNLYHTSAVPLLRSVWDYARATRWESARKILFRAAQIDPTDPRIMAYRAVIDEAEGKFDDALHAFRVALWLTPAQDRVRTGFRLRMARMLFHAGRFQEVETLLSQDLFNEATLNRYDLPNEIYLAMLPDPNINSTVVPMNDNLASQIAWTHVWTGAAKFHLKKYEDAIAVLKLTQEFERLLINGTGMTRVEKARLHGALWLAKCCVELGRLDEAGRWAALLPRKRSGAGPSLNPHAELEEEGTKLQAEIQQRKAGLPVDRAKPAPGDKEKKLRNIVESAGVTDDDAALRAQIEQCIDRIYSDQLGERWKQEAAGSIMNVATGREAAQLQVDRLKGFLQRRNDARTQKQLKDAEARLDKYTKAVEGLKKAAIERGYPADQIDRDIDPSGDRRRR